MADRKSNLGADIALSGPVRSSVRITFFTVGGSILSFCGKS